MFQDEDSDTTGGTRSDRLLNDSDEERLKHFRQQRQVIKVPPMAARKSTRRIHPHVINKLTEKANCLIFTRHAETADCVSSTWTKESFVNGNEYKPFDLNLPRKVPERTDAATKFAIDPPLSILGTKMAAILGREFASMKLIVRAVYVSPALSCVETASRFLSQAISGEGAKAKPKIRVEPALFDFVSSTETVKPPTFMKERELVDAGMDIDGAYKPILSEGRLMEVVGKETPDEFAKRCHEAVQEIIKKNSPLGVILIVTHARVMHVAARCLSGKAFRRLATLPGSNASELSKAEACYPYMAMLPMAPTSYIEPVETQALPCFSNACSFHRLPAYGGGETTRPEQAMWHQIYGVMPRFTTENYNNRFNCNFFKKPLGN